MLLQFPIADLRSFVDAADTRVRAALDFAAIAQARAGSAERRDRPFLRHLGPLRRRRQQGLGVAGEVMAFGGANMLRWPDGLHAVPHPRDGTPVPMRLLFRRFQPFGDGRDGAPHRLARYEVAWLLDVNAGGRAAPTPPELDALIDACLALPVAVAQYDAPAPRRRRAVPLADAGGLVARQLRWATQARPHSGAALPPEWTVQAATPAVLVEFGTEELAGDPAGAAPAPYAAAPDIAFWAQERWAEGRRSACWFVRSHLPRVERNSPLDPRDPARAQQLRNLRVAVLRQHAEREVLASVLASLALPGRLQPEGLRDDAPASPAGVALHEYLVAGAALLARRERTQRQLPLEGAARAVDEADDERRRRVQHQLSMVLGAQTLAQLQQALSLLPMGSLESDERIAGLAAAGRPPPVRIAVSYAHADERDARLLTGLREATHRDALDGGVVAWTDLRIEPGTEWDPAIEQALREADVIVLLLSPAFLASEFCMQREVPRALELAAAGGCEVLPVEALDCGGRWQGTPIARLQLVQPWGRAVLAHGNRLAAWAVVRHAIYRAAVRLHRRREAAAQAGQPESGSP